MKSHLYLIFSSLIAIIIGGLGLFAILGSLVGFTASGNIGFTVPISMLVTGGIAIWVAFWLYKQRNRYYKKSLK